MKLDQTDKKIIQLLGADARMSNNQMARVIGVTEGTVRNRIQKLIKNRVIIKIATINHLIAHIIYHAAFHHKFNMGPVFLYDIKFLLDRITNHKGLENLLDHMNLVDVFKNLIAIYSVLISFFRELRAFEAAHILLY